MTVLDRSYGSNYYFTEGLALAYAPNSGKIGYLDKKGALVIPYQYSYGRPFFENAAVVQDNKGNYGVILI
ncbi:WG repeat-containing protein [Paenibacillus wulumuqiensis]|uniref:WG repeat-containing protein n=1 Tax=Paenibacillus wulumuqiensis TaxID=1567107 RepID=UPI0006963405|nr:WG repeat-containing protein [Paenibacillus wulumuqiensis]